ncbi:MAG: hypothetical protein M3Y69_01005 [Verrucomicrobiota bacterium]|nr:hypothetical protein [Verrucomicrobiota bacterium]
MKRLLACIIIAAVAASSSEGRKRRSTLRVHLEANAHDSDVFSTQLRSATTGRNITIEKVPTISEFDVASFRAYPAADGTFGVLFQLNDHGKLALDTLSIDRRGTMLYLFVNGRPAAELQIDRRVADGKLYVPSGMTASDIELMKNDWPASGVSKKRP